MPEDRKEDHTFEEYGLTVSWNKAFKCYQATLREFGTFGDDFWPLGKNVAEAVGKLRGAFERFKREHPEELPLPGYCAPITIAPRDKLDEYKPIAEEIFGAIGYDMDGIVVTDLVRLSDYGEDGQETALLFIKERFGIDVSFMKNEVVWKICRYIQEHAP